MSRKLIDISVTLDADIVADPEFMQPKIDYSTHEDTVDQMASFFPGLDASSLPSGEGWAVETLHVSSHNGTHLDAPYHHHSTMDGGIRAITIDEVPLEWCLGRAVKLDFRYLPDGHIVQPAEIEAELRRIGHELQPLDIVVVNTSAGLRYGKTDYLEAGCGVGREATLWLLERGVRVTGTDAWSWDAPFNITRERWLKEHNPSIIWEGHRASIEIGYCHMEKLSNLETLPSTGFEISCFPIKLKGGSAGFTRAVAILND
ncbi:cyclase family protein [Halomonas sp. KO116]|uniref:cyclase family protein n=1 Tax=Halomonas sp. KO116 TaxID=1504981 RepID=UPI0004E36E71|nr:cyclase family protein [Halomonas sp. KO116]AJY52343.1 cyclase family protein [Halomonas sp. KO116]